MVTRAVARIGAASTLAADTLRKLLKAQSETVRLGAARAILELGSKLREQEDLAERVRALEERLGEQKEGKSWSRPLPTRTSVMRSSSQYNTCPTWPSVSGGRRRHRLRRSRRPSSRSGP